MSLRRMAHLALAVCALSLSACGIDAEVAEYCRIHQTCVCDDSGCCMEAPPRARCDDNGACCSGYVCHQGACLSEPQGD